MTTFFVSRHPGAHEWARRKGFHNVEVVAHFDPSIIRPGDEVLGTLPIHLAAEVCSRGGKFDYLELNIPAEFRGRELTAEDMERFGAKLVRFEVRQAHATQWVLRDSISGEPYAVDRTRPQDAGEFIAWNGREAYWAEEKIL